jgi:PAS domain S-box-containing protein
LFAWLLLGQWGVAVLLALILSLLTWTGSTAGTHPHVWAAVGLGGLVVALPVGLARLRPGEPLTRHVVAAAQLMMSGVLIHLTGGRIETHVHVFGSLALLSFYKDWRVLVTASAVTAADHFARGWVWPESIDGTAVGVHWRWVEHAGWVLLIDIFLGYSCVRAVRDIRAVAEREAALEAAREGVEAVVRTRTAELRRSEEWFRSAFDDSAIGMAVVAGNGRFLAVNPALCAITGYTEAELLDRTHLDITHPDDHSGPVAPADRSPDRSPDRAVRSYQMEKRYVRKDGGVVWVLLSVSEANPDGKSAARFIAQIQDITERKQAVEEIRAGRAFTQAVLDSLAAHIAVLDSRGTIVAVNAAWERFAASNAGEPSACGLGVNYLAVCRSAAGPCSTEARLVADGLSRVLEHSADSFALEYPCDSPDEEQWFAVDVTPLCDRSAGVVVSHQNITARKRAEAERDRLFTESLTLMCVAGYDGRFRRVNPVWQATFGFTVDEYLARPFLDFVHPDDRARTAAEVAKVAAGERTRDFTIRGLCKDGTFRWVAWNANSLDRTQFFATGQDITERKAAVDDLERARQQLVDAIESLDAGFVMYGPDERLVVCNTRYKEIYAGCAHKMTPGTPYREILEAFCESGGHAHTGLTAAAWVAGRLEAHRNPGPPVEQWLADRWVRIGDRRTSDGGVVSLRTDVTALKRAQEAAEAANKAKGEFLANVSHEIRTPLNAVLGLTELALRTDLTREQREYLSTAKQSAEGLLAVINDVLDFSKIEAGKLDLDPAPFSLRSAVDEVLRLAALGAEAKGVELVADIGPGVPDDVVGDVSRLRQILTNLVGNAVKFTPAGEVVVRVEAAAGPAAPRFAFAVRDTGVGIPADKLRAIFEPFTQADGSTTRRYGGTGLGLAISARLVRLMGGGDIRVASEPGRGSEFGFDLPFGRASGSSASWVARPPAALLDAPVLVAVANPTVRRVLADYLREWGGKPSPAEPQTAGAELRRAADAGTPYLLAVVEPGGDGEPPRRLEPCRKFIVLAYSQHSGPTVPLPEGAVAQNLTKPVKSADLLRAVAAVLRASEAVPHGHPAAVAQVPVRRSLKVLVAEDNPVNQMVMSRLLERDGHTAVVANHGGEAVEAFDREPFDLILMDVQMPEMDGFEATRRIRERQAAGGRMTPIVAMTAHAMTGDRERCLDAGMDDYLPKPFPLDDLARVLAWATDLADRSPPDPPPAPVPEPAGHDIPAALVRLGGDRTLFADLAALFRAELPQVLAELRRSAADADAAGLRRVVHGLKGSAAYVGGTGVSAVAREMETLAANGAVADAFGHLPRLEAELGRLLTALEEFSRPGSA